MYTVFVIYVSRTTQHLHSFPTRRSSDLGPPKRRRENNHSAAVGRNRNKILCVLHAFQVLTRSARSTSVNSVLRPFFATRSEEHTSELQSLRHLVCRLLLEKKKQHDYQLH